MNLRGTGVAVITPFNKDKVLDESAFRKTVQHLISGKVEYVVVMGTTGESVTLSPVEKSKILQWAGEETQGKISLVCGIGGNNTQSILDQIEKTDFTHVDAILSVSPYYNKPSQPGIIEHYQTIADKAPVPVILYNVPGRTGSNIAASTTLQLAEHENIAGIKEASGNPEQCSEILKNKPGDFLVVSGDDPLTLPYLALGMEGVISVTANAFPFEMSEMVRCCLNGDFEQARRYHYQLFDYMQRVFQEGNPAGIKALMSIKGFCENIVRLPLATVSDKLYQQLLSMEKSQ